MTGEGETIAEVGSCLIEIMILMLSQCLDMPLSARDLRIGAIFLGLWLFSLMMIALNTAAWGQALWRALAPAGGRAGATARRQRADALELREDDGSGPGRGPALQC